MSPKEKAVLLVASMSFSKAKVADYETGQMVDVPGNIFSKQCALIAVDEVLNVIDNFEMIYWEQVKQEIEKL
jgi:hypothetical protein